MMAVGFLFLFSFLPRFRFGQFSFPAQELHMYYFLKGFERVLAEHFDDEMH